MTDFHLEPYLSTARDTETMMVGKRMKKRERKRKRAALWPGFWFQRDVVPVIGAPAGRDRMRF